MFSVRNNTHSTHRTHSSTVNQLVPKAIRAGQREPFLPLGDAEGTTPHHNQCYQIIIFFLLHFRHFKMSAQNEVLVFYASKTGNAQAIAERIHEEAAANGWKSSLEQMNKFKKLPHKLEDNKFIICVVSTTGTMLFYRLI
jgi:flavorubredoxin